jgi:hypothetical protein
VLVAPIIGSSTRLCLHSSPLGPKQRLILNVNGVLCYFPPSAILQGNVKVFGINVDRAKVEVKVGVEIFFPKAFEKFNVIIWSCTKFKDVLEVFLMLMLENFMDWFIFIWGREQYSKMFSQISPRSHYYLKDLKCIYYGYYGLP